MKVEDTNKHSTVKHQGEKKNIFITKLIRPISCSFYTLTFSRPRVLYMRGNIQLVYENSKRLKLLFVRDILGRSNQNHLCVSLRICPLVWSGAIVRGLQTYNKWKIATNTHFCTKHRWSFLVTDVAIAMATTTEECRPLNQK